jgi:hypothetical protein
MFTLAFWKAATERAVKSFAQAILTAYFVGDVALNALQADWVNMLGFGLGGAAFSILTSLAFGAGDGNPSATNAETTPNGGKHAA